MPFTTYYGPTTIVQENEIWLADGSRRICITYQYNTSNGVLQYAATVYQCDIYNTDDGLWFYLEPSYKQMTDHANTTRRRYTLRPVILVTDRNLSYEDILKTIRREMVQGFGCKGPRGLRRSIVKCDSDTSSDIDSTSGDNNHTSDVGSTSSDNTWISETLDEEYVVEDKKFNKLIRKPIRKLRYISDTNVENYNGKKIPIIREIFIAFKANKNTGDLLYGAAISRRPAHLGHLDNDMITAHYNTAIGRLEKHSVYTIVNEEYRHQLVKNAKHREDIMYHIVDCINKRSNGRFSIREYL